MNTIIKDVVKTTEENMDSILNSFNEVEFIKELSKSHPNLTDHLMVIFEINCILYGLDISNSIIKTILFMIYLLSMSNENDMDFKNMFSDEDIKSLNDILGEL